QRLIGNPDRLLVLLLGLGGRVVLGDQGIDGGCVRFDGSGSSITSAAYIAKGARNSSARADEGFGRLFRLSYGLPVVRQQLLACQRLKQPFLYVFLCLRDRPFNHLKLGLNLLAGLGQAARL